MEEKTKEYRNNITLHLTRISGDIEHIKEKVDSEFKYVKDKVNSNNNHLEKINGRLRKAENSITGIKSIGITLYAVIGGFLTYLGLKD